MSLLRAVATVSGFTMMSRITGFARDILIASILGAGPIADAFFIAFKFPNFFRRLTAEGAFTVAFVPTFSRLLQDKGRKDALEFAEEVISIMGIGLFLFSFFVIVFMPTVMLGLAPGFIERDWLFDLTVELARITFIYLTPISLVALLGGILNSFGKFGAMASAPILLNIILIVSLVFFENSMETKGHVLAIAVAISGVAQFIWLLEACRQNGSIPKLRRPRVTERVKKLFKLMLPAVLGAGVVQINLLIDIILASTLPSGSISFLYFADRINQLPLALIGIAIGTALLPKLSREIQCGELEKAKRSQDQALEFGMVLALPAAVGLLVLSQPIISTLFERGAFSPTAVDATAQTLFCYALGLPAFIIIKVLQPSFFARYDTLTPVKVASFMVLTNLVLNIILMQFLAHAGLALATSITAWLNAAILAFILKQKGLHQHSKKTYVRLVRTFMASAVMGMGLLGLIEFVGDSIFGSKNSNILSLAALILLGLFLYIIPVFLFRVIRLSEVRQEIKSWVKNNQ